MLAVWCFTVFAAVGERLAVSGKREERGGQDGEREHPFSFLCIRIFLPVAAHFIPWCWLWFYWSGISVPSSPLA